MQLGNHPFDGVRSHIPQVCCQGTLAIGGYAFGFSSSCISRNAAAFSPATELRRQGIFCPIPGFSQIIAFEPIFNLGLALHGDGIVLSSNVDFDDGKTDGLRQLDLEALLQMA